jgi:rod shape-determining protein MreD
MINMVVFVLLQTLVINNIHLFGIVTPFVYFYVLLKMPVDMNRSYIILLSFFLGLVIDSFSNTFGIHAAACSLLGFVRNPLVEQFVDVRELPGGSVPSYRLFGFGKFFYYTLILVTLHHAVLFSIDSFGFFQPAQLFKRMLSSIALTVLLLVIIETFNYRKVKRGE